MSRPVKFDAVTIALAMELREERVSWKLLNRYLGDGIRDAVVHASRVGAAPYWATTKI